MDQGLTRHERIRRRPEFLKVQQRGTRTRGRHLTLFTLPNGLKQNRLGIIATRKLGGATRRNRAKKGPAGAAGFDIVALLRPGFPDIAFSILEADFQGVLHRYVDPRR